MGWRFHAGHGSSGDLLVPFVTVGKEVATSQDSVPKKEAVGRLLLLLLVRVGVKSAQSTRVSSSVNVNET